MSNDLIETPATDNELVATEAPAGSATCQNL